MSIATTTRRLGLVAAGLVVAGSLASCGGHDDGNPTPPPPAPTSNTPPASAAGSVDGFIAYLKTVVAVPLDTSDPLDVSTFVAPTSDVTEPDPTI